MTKFFRRSRRTRKVSLIQKTLKYWFREIYVKDLQLHLEMDAMRETLEYIKSNMSDSMIFTDWHDLHAYAMEHVNVDGMFLELGVKRGGSIRELARMTGNTIHGFDSFAGLPEDWSGTPLRKGRFHIRRRLPRMPGNVVLHRGWFEESLPEFKQEFGEPIAYMHVDCDIYSSTRTVFKCFADRIVPGTVIVFDEYFNYPNWRQHEYRAFQEFVAGHGVNYKYLGFISYEGIVAVKITGKDV